MHLVPATRNIDMSFQFSTVEGKSTPMLNFYMTKFSDNCPACTRFKNKVEEMRLELFVMSPQAPQSHERLVLKLLLD